MNEGVVKSILSAKQLGKHEAFVTDRIINSKLATHYRYSDKRQTYLAS